MSRTMVHASSRAFRLAVRWLTGQEAGVLLAALAIVLALLVFSKTAGEMMEGDLREFDDGVLRMMRSTDDPSVPIGPAWLVQVAIDVTALGGTAVLALILIGFLVSSGGGGGGVGGGY